MSESIYKELSIENAKIAFDMANKGIMHKEIAKHFNTTTHNIRTAITDYVNKRQLEKYTPVILESKKEDKPIMTEFTDIANLHNSKRDYKPIPSGIVLDALPGWYGKNN